MVTSLVLILWPSSVFFSAVLGFRVGMWWRTIRTSNRHAVVSIRCYRSDKGELDDGEYWLPERPAGIPETWMEDESGEDYPDDVDFELDDGFEDGAAAMDSPPAEAKPVRWWSNDDDTKVLPRIQDIRPPWVGKIRRSDNANYKQVQASTDVVVTVDGGGVVAAQPGGDGVAVICSGLSVEGRLSHCGGGDDRTARSA